METILFDGELLELPEKQKPPVGEDGSELSAKDIGKLSNPLINTKEATDFINGFVHTGGEIKNSVCRCYSPIEGYAFFLKECFDFYGIVGYVENMSKVWLFESSPYVELTQLENEWYFNKRRIVHEFDKTPITLLLWFLRSGRFYEYRQFKSKGMSFDRTVKIHIALQRIGIDCFIKNSSSIYIKEPDYKKFFTYVCEVPFLIPECFHYKFPDEFIQYNKEWVLSHKQK